MLWSNRKKRSWTSWTKVCLKNIFCRIRRVIFRQFQASRRTLPNSWKRMRQKAFRSRIWRKGDFSRADIASALRPNRLCTDDFQVVNLNTLSYNQSFKTKLKTRRTGAVFGRFWKELSKRIWIYNLGPSRCYRWHSNSIRRQKNTCSWGGKRKKSGQQTGTKNNDQMFF